MAKYYVAIDIRGNVGESEAQQRAPIHEIVEFTLILVETSTRQLIHEQFHSFVKPRENPILSPQCIKDYGIKQYVVSQASEWPTVLKKADAWLDKKGYDPRVSNFILVADGTFEMEKILISQCRLNGITIPRWAQNYINIKKEFAKVYQTKGQWQDLTVPTMLHTAEMEFEGVVGHGRDECFNLALLAAHLLRKAGQLTCIENMRV